MYTPKNLTGRSNRQMTVYYNVLNILGDRMGKNLATSVVLVGSSELGPEDGQAMAESIKEYLVSVLELIFPYRNRRTGQAENSLPSSREARPTLRSFARGIAGVSIESSSPTLLAGISKAARALRLGRLKS
ncbi:MAG: hypothetical protein IPJ00_11995 [Saprospirales bacterium]|nr:hypothetical protein [Saprospirales bacterium]